MEQQDHLRRQIEQLGRVLGKILSDLVGLKQKGQVNQGIEITDRALKNELDLDTVELMAIPTDNFITTLKNTKGFNNENLDKLADILLVIANNEENKNENRNMLYEKCLTIYQYLEKSEPIYSFDRHLKMERIKNLL